MLRVKGKVFSGKSEGAKFVELPWVKKQITEELGFVPYPGTLNIKLTENNISLQKFLEKAKAIQILPTAGFCHGKCFKAYLIDNIECAIVVPEIANYPQDVIEIIASVNLREKLKLKDSDVVEIEIML